MTGGNNMRSMPKYDIRSQDMRNIFSFNTFLLNFVSSDWLAAQFSPEFVADAIAAERETEKLASRHVLSGVYVPLTLNSILTKFGFQRLSITLSKPLNVIGYTNKMVDLINAFCKKHGNIFENKFFLPANCPDGSVLFFGDIQKANTLFAHYLDELENSGFSTEIHIYAS
jgi:hypothetical protein